MYVWMYVCMNVCGISRVSWSPFHWNLFLLKPLLSPKQIRTTNLYQILAPHARQTVLQARRTDYPGTVQRRAQLGRSRGTGTESLVSRCRSFLRPGRIWVQGAHSWWRSASCLRFGEQSEDLDHQLRLVRANSIDLAQSYWNQQTTAVLSSIPLCKVIHNSGWQGINFKISK